MTALLAVLLVGMSFGAIAETPQPSQESVKQTIIWPRSGRPWWGSPLDSWAERIDAHGQRGPSIHGVVPQDIVKESLRAIAELRRSPRVTELEARLFSMIREKTAEFDARHTVIAELTKSFTARQRSLEPEAKEELRRRIERLEGDFQRDLSEVDREIETIQAELTGRVRAVVPRYVDWATKNQGG
jgi:Skp family chaperone for outer membrane proteins